MSGHVVIVGAGQGGQTVAASLRQEGFDGAITLIGAEPGLPYQRPPLSKAYMADGLGERLHLKPAGWYETAAIDYRPDTAVSNIDRARRVVTAGEAEIGYDHLVLATGARVLRPPLPGLEAPGVFQLRTLADAARLRAALTGATRAVVIGGGFIGLEFAAMARGAGVAVTVLEAGARLMARAVSPAMSAHFLALHRALGSEIRFGAPAAAVITAQGRASGVALADGSEITGDLVLLAVGVRPNQELAEIAGLACDNGIVVDAQLRSDDRAISALGDVASFPWPGQGRVRLESVQAAVDHGRHIARRIASGAEAPYAATPWFWSDQGKAKLQIAGLSAGAEQFEPREGANGAPMVLAFRGDRLLAVETVNAPGQHMAARRLIGASRGELAAQNYDLRASAAARKAAG